MGSSLYETSLQGIMVVVFVILDWIIVLMTTTTMILLQARLKRELSIKYLLESIRIFSF